MDVDEMVKGARDALTVARVYGEPIERGEVTVIPVAKTLGGSGGGTGQSAAGDGGDGGGFGVRVKPVGVYVIAGGKVRWVPAVDPVRILLVAGVTAIGVLGALRGIAEARAGRAARIAKAVTIARRIAKAKARAARR